MVVGTGVVGGLMASVMGLILAFAMRDSLFGFGGLAGALMGILTGYPVGVNIGMILFWKLFKYQGSLWFGIPASILGAALPILLAEGLNLNISALWVFSLFFILSPLLGATAFYLGRKNRSTKKNR